MCCAIQLAHTSFVEVRIQRVLRSLFDPAQSSNKLADSWAAQRAAHKKAFMMSMPPDLFRNIRLGNTFEDHDEVCIFLKTMTAIDFASISKTSTGKALSIF